MEDIKHCQYCGKEFTKKLLVSRQKWERQRFCSQPCGNKGKDSSHLKRYSFKKGVSANPDTQFNSTTTTGVNNINWKGDNASYAAKHIWVKYHYGNPQRCDHCKTTDKRMYHWANISGEYKRDRNDWLRLCVPCHKRADLHRRREDYHN